MAESLDTEDGVTVTIERGDDGVPVVFVDTSAATGPIRIRLNDALVWTGDPEARDATVERAAHEGLYLSTL